MTIFSPCCVVLSTGYCSHSSDIPRGDLKWYPRAKGASCQGVGRGYQFDECHSTTTICSKHHWAPDSYSWRPIHVERQSRSPTDSGPFVRQGMCVYLDLGHFRLNIKGLLQFVLHDVIGLHTLVSMTPRPIRSKINYS